MAVVAVPVVLNSIGVYAHIEHALASDLTVASKAADIDAHLSGLGAAAADRLIHGRVDLSDPAVEVCHDARLDAMVLADQQRKNRTEFVASRTTDAGKLTSLKVEKAAVDGESKAVDTDLGPRYIAMLLASTDEQTMRCSSSWWRCCSTCRRPAAPSRHP